MPSPKRFVKRASLSGLIVVAFLATSSGVASADVKIDQKINTQGANVNQKIRIQGSTICIDQKVKVPAAGVNQRVDVNGIPNCDDVKKKNVAEKKKNDDKIKNDNKKRNDQKKKNDNKNVKASDDKAFATINQPTFIPLNKKNVADAPAATTTTTSAPKAPQAAEANKLALTGSNSQELAGIAMVLTAFGIVLLSFTSAFGRTKSLIRSLNPLRNSRK